MADKPEVDAVTGTLTTGHVWDDIRELNTPLPRWWLWLFYITIIWSIGYWIVYPAWPLVSSFTAAGRSSFRENCGPCHGAGGGGARGYPNLNDNDWLWGGTLGQIQQTIEFGVRSGHAKAHESQMPAFGRDGMLKAAEIVNVANYVRSIANLATRPSADLAAGKKIFAETCSVCHGDDGKGNKELGAPNLTDGIWLFGSDEATIIEVITNSRGGVMPAWAGRLDPVTIKALAYYVHSLGGGEK
jgi:cytochrome c oxidase cbb3-type subunit 3